MTVIRLRCRITSNEINKLIQKRLAFIQEAPVTIIKGVELKNVTRNGTVVMTMSSEQSQCMSSERSQCDVCPVSERSRCDVCPVSSHSVMYVQ